MNDITILLVCITWPSDVSIVLGNFKKRHYQSTTENCCRENGKFWGEKLNKQQKLYHRAWFTSLLLNIVPSLVNRLIPAKNFDFGSGSGHSKTLVFLVCDARLILDRYIKCCISVQLLTHLLSNEKDRFEKY